MLLDHLCLSYKSQTSDYLTDCLWCGGQKLSIAKTDDYQFQCWNCKQTGNAFSIIRRFHEWVDQPDSYSELTHAKKGVHTQQLRDQQVVEFNGYWFLPIFNHKKQIISIHKYRIDGEGVYNCPEPCNCSMLGLEKFDTENKLVIIAEGWWDYFVARRITSAHQSNVIATTGSTFPVDYLYLLDGMTVITAYDNDEAGRNGTHKLHVDLKRSVYKPEALFFLDWSDLDKPDKYDIRDLNNEFENPTPRIKQRPKQRPQQRIKQRPKPKV